MQNLVTFITICFVPLICYFLIYFMVFGNKKKSVRAETGFDVARRILDANGLNNMYIVESRGVMYDEYDFNQRVIRLSSSVYHQNNISSIAVASFVASTAVMDKENDQYLKVKSMFFPIAEFLLVLSVLLVVFGSLLGLISISGLAIAILLIVLAYSLAMIPLSFNIIKRALSELTKTNLADPNEMALIKNTLNFYSISCVSVMVDGFTNFVMNSLNSKKK